MELQELKKQYSHEVFKGDFPDWHEGKNVICPFHDDKTPSLSISKGDSGEYLFHCFGCDKRGDVINFIEHKENINNTEAIKLFLDRFNGNSKKAEIVKTYDYHDENGKLLYQAVRLKPKGFKQRQPDGKGDWIWKMDGVKRVLYRLFELLKADTVFIVEGEKDADNLAVLGLTATTNVGGAGKWKPEYNQYLKGKDVVILPDNDEPGKGHAQNIASQLKVIARSIKVIELPGLPEKGDVSDWLKAGGTKEELLNIVQKEKQRETTEDNEQCSIKKDSELFPDCPFPDQALPGQLRELCKQVSEAYQVNVNAVHAIMLSTLSGCIGNSIEVHINAIWKQPCFLWFVLIGKTGMGKSDIQNFFMSHITDLQSQKYKKYQKKLKTYKKLKTEYDRDKKKNIDLKEPEMPILEHLFTSDSTTEKLYSIFEHNPRGIICNLDEFSSLVKGFNQYKKAGNDKEHYQKIWNSQADKIDRKTQETIFCQKTGMSIVSGTQPKEITQIFSDDFYDSGFVPRFLFFSLEHTNKRYKKVIIEDKATWSGLVNFAYELETINSSGDIVPHQVYFSPEAEQVFKEYYEYLEDLRPFLSDKGQSFISKIEKYFSRFAGILHVMDCHFNNRKISIDISKETAEHSMQLCMFFMGQAMKLVEFGKEKEEPTGYEKRIVNVLFELQNEVKNGRLQIGIITQSYNTNIPENAQLSTRKVGDLLRSKLKLNTEMKGGFSWLLWDGDKIKKLFLKQRHGHHGHHGKEDNTMKKEEIFDMT